MSDNQRRWLCKECHREWVEPRAWFVNSSPCSITGNPINSGNCSVCGSPEIIEVEFNPSVPGLDIPREEVGKSAKIITGKILEVIPSTTTNRNFSIRSNPPSTLLGDREPKDFIVPSLTLVSNNDTIKENSQYDLSDMD